MASLVPAGTTPTDVLYGNLDGAGPEEIVVVAAGPKLGGLQIHEQQVFVFAWSGTGWTPVLDASAFPGGGRPILSPPGAGSDQEVTLLKLVDLQGDGSPEVVLAVGRVGGSTEPVDLWVLSDDTSSVTVALHLKDLVKVPGPGGTVKVEGDRVLAVQSPYCGAAPFCPGYQTTQVVGSNPGGIAVVRTTTEAIKAKSPAEAAEGLLWAWEQGDRIAALTVASTSAVDGLFAISPSGGDPVVDSCTPYTQPAWDCEWFDPSYPQSGGLGLGLFVDPAPDGGYTVTLLNASSSPGE